MAPYAQETAYFLNPKLPRVAFIAKGLRFPTGHWIRLAGETVLPWYVEQLVGDLFPALSGTALPIAMLLTEFDVDEFERGLQQPVGGQPSA